MKLKFLIPLLLFAALGVALLVGLGKNPREVPSPLIGKPAPAFTLPQLNSPQQTIGTGDMKGKVWVMNVWASWCVPCRAEHPLFVELGKQNIAPIVGLNYKNERADAQAWLKQFGDPYAAVAYDYDGRVGIDYGVYGVPETFIIDKAGVIRFKQIGPVTPEVMREKIMPLIRQLQA